MGHLDRYKKPGGFMQLLELIESFAPAKQEKFLNLIEEENPVWSKSLKEKLITFQRIVKWPSATLAEICPHMNVSLMAIAIKGLPDEQLQHFLAGLPAGEKRKIQNEMEIVKPQPNEVASSHQKMIETVRKLIGGGQIRLEAVDPGVILSEHLEEQLLRMSTFVKGDMNQLTNENEGQLAAPVERPSAELIKEAVRGAAPQAVPSDMKSQQALVLTLQKEIKALRSENKLLKDKLEAIRKIA